MPGQSVNTNSNSAKSVNNSGQVQNSSGLKKLDKPTIVSKTLAVAKQHRLNHLTAFSHAHGGIKGLKNTEAMLNRAANPKMIKQYEALFGTTSGLIKTAIELKRNLGNSQHLSNVENVRKVKFLSSFARPLNEFNEALKLADGAPQVGKNFDAYRENLAIKSENLKRIAKDMPNNAEGIQMRELCISLASVCEDKSKLIAENQKFLDSLIVYDAAIDDVTQKMDPHHKEMEEIVVKSLDHTKKLASDNFLSENDKTALETEQILSANRLVSLSEKLNELAAQHHYLLEAQREQENKIGQLHPALQKIADAKLALEDPLSAQLNLLQEQELQDELEQLEKQQVLESAKQKAQASNSPTVPSTNTNPKMEQSIVQVNNAATNSAAPNNVAPNNVVVNSADLKSQAVSNSAPTNTVSANSLGIPAVKVPVNTVAETAQLQENDLTLKSYSSALDLLNVKIANLYASGKIKEALTLIICREKLRASLNDQAEKAKNENPTKAVKNILPGGQKKLGLISRIRVKFQAKTALKLGKDYRPLNPNITKLDAKTTLAAYLQGAFKQAGLSGADVPSKAELREALQKGINNPRNYSDFGKIDASLPFNSAEEVQPANTPVVDKAAINSPAEPKKDKVLLKTYTDKSDAFETMAKSSYEKITTQRYPFAIRNRSVGTLFSAHQYATKLIVANDLNSSKHIENRKKIEAEISRRMDADPVLSNGAMFADKGSLFTSARLISADEIINSLKNVSRFENAGGLQAYSQINDAQKALENHLAISNGPAYALVNDNQHWISVLAHKGADGKINYYVVDTANLQANSNNALPNDCGPLQILLQSELDLRLQQNPTADPIDTMKEIQADFDAIDKSVLRNVVLTQRKDTLQQIIKMNQDNIDADNAQSLSRKIDLLADDLKVA